MTPNEAQQLVLVGYADHSGKVTKDVNTEVSSGQSKGQHPIYLTRAAVAAREKKT